MHSAMSAGGRGSGALTRALFASVSALRFGHSTLVPGEFQVAKTYLCQSSAKRVALTFESKASAARCGPDCLLVELTRLHNQCFRLLHKDDYFKTQDAYDR
jgi:hypothetical protein